MLAAIWEVWEWSRDDFLILGVLLLFFGLYGAGFAQGRYPGFGFEDYGEMPAWVQLAVLALMVGTVISFIAIAPEAEP